MIVWHKRTAEQLNNSVADRSFRAQWKTSVRLEKEKRRNFTNVISVECCTWTQTIITWTRRKTVRLCANVSAKRVNYNLYKYLCQGPEYDKRSKFPDIKTGCSSIGWCNHFMNRYGSCIQTRIKIAQKLPKELEINVHFFQKYII